MTSSMCRAGLRLPRSNLKSYYLWPQQPPSRYSHSLWKSCFLGFDFEQPLSPGTLIRSCSSFSTALSISRGFSQTFVRIFIIQFSYSSFFFLYSLLKSRILSAIMARDLLGSTLLRRRADQTKGANFDSLSLRTNSSRFYFDFSLAFSESCLRLSSTKASNFYVLGIFWKSSSGSAFSYLLSRAWLGLSLGTSQVVLDLTGLFQKEKGQTLMGSLMFLAFSRSKCKCSWIVLKSGTPYEILGMKVQSPIVPVEAVRAFAARFSSLSSCRLIILWTPSGSQQSVFLVIISSKIFYLLSAFFLLMRSISLTSQYHGMTRAQNLNQGWPKSQ